MSHIQKWTEVCEELRENHPNSSVTLWVKGYVFGLNHYADVVEDIDLSTTPKPKNALISKADSHRKRDECSHGISFAKICGKCEADMHAAPAFHSPRKG